MMSSENLLLFIGSGLPCFLVSKVPYQAVCDHKCLLYCRYCSERCRRSRAPKAEDREAIDEEGAEL